MNHKTLVDRLAHWAEEQPSALSFHFLVDGEDETVRLTFAELDGRARAIGAHLLDAGMFGERALMLFPPGLDFVEAFFGCLYAGAIPVPAFPPRKNRNMKRLEAISNDAQAKMALTAAEVYDRVYKSLDESSGLRHLEWLATDRVPSEKADNWQRPQIDDDTIALLQYTSGSTGSPKGVVLTHRNVMHNCSLISGAFELRRTEEYGMTWLPTYHDMGLLGGILSPLYVGSRHLLMSPMAFLTKPIRWLQAITRHKITVSGGPNFAYALCTEKITPEQCEGLDLSSWELAFNGAEPIRPETLRAFTKKFAPFGFRAETHYPCYGMAETALIVTGGVKQKEPVIQQFDASALDDRRVIPLENGNGSGRSLVGCGRVLPDEEVVIVDPEAHELAPQNRVGEIWVHSPSVGQGYWQKPDETKRIFQANLNGNGSEPWLRTGDLGFLHEGELFVTGRLKDLIIIRGVNRYPQDIESTAENASVRVRPGGTGAFAVDQDGRERLIVVSEVERRSENDWDEIIDAIRRDVTLEHEVPPDAIVLVRAGSMPKTSSGKIQRHACRQQYLDGQHLVLAQWSSDGCPTDTAENKNGSASHQSASVPSSNGNGKSTNGKIPAAYYQFGQFPEYTQLLEAKERLNGAGKRMPFSRLREGVPASTTVVEGKELVNFASFNYLGMSGDPEVSQAAIKAIQEFGTSVSGSRLTSGENSIHRELERELATFIGTDDALTFVGGHTASETTIGHLFDRDDLILYDEEVHSRVVKGAELSGAKLQAIQHNNVDDLDTFLKQHRHDHRRVLIAVEGLYSRDGDCCDLPRLLEVKHRHKTMLLVDEAHSLGTMGMCGRGTAEHFGVTASEVDLWTGTLGKSLGSCGGYVAGAKELIEYLRCTASGFVFATGISPANAAAALAALRLLQSQPQRVANLQANSRMFAMLAKQRGLQSHGTVASPIVSLVVGDSVQVIDLAAQLVERGISALPFVHPVVDEETARIKFIVTSAHTEDQIRFAVDSVSQELSSIASLK